MRRIAEFLGGLALLGGLGAAGTAVAAALALPVPGPVLGLLAYLALLALGWAAWSAAAARWLAGLLGALIVPPLVGVAAFTPVLAAGGWRLAVALVGGCLVTGVVTALTFRRASR
jgi:holin-like protein